MGVARPELAGERLHAYERFVADRQLANLIEHAWSQGLSLTLPTLVERVAVGFSDVVALRPRIDGRSGNPATLQAMAPTDVALAVYFQISGEVLAGDLRLALAYQDLEPFLDRVPVAHTDAGDDAIAADRDAIERAVRDVALGMSVVLGRTAITMRSLLALRPGDVVRVDRVVGASLEADIEGVTRLRGDVVRSGGARAPRVTEVLRGNEDEAQ